MNGAPIEAYGESSFAGSKEHSCGISLILGIGGFIGLA